MKLKELAKCAREDETFTLLDEFDQEGMLVRQYVYLPKRAIFPLDGLPMVNEEQLMTMMDIPKEKQSGWHVGRAQMSERLSMMVSDARNTDMRARCSWIGLTMNGMAVRAVFSDENDSKIGFVENGLLKVLSDLKGLEMFERMVDGSRVYVLMNGMMNVGCLTPTKEHWSKRCAKELACVGLEARRVYDAWERTGEADR